MNQLIIALLLLLSFQFIYCAPMTTATNVFLTQKATILETTNFPSFIEVNNVSVPFVTGSINALVAGNGFVYGCTNDLIVRVNVTDDGATTSDFDTFKISSIYVANIDLLVIDNVNNRALLFGNPGGDAKVAFFHLNTFLPSENPIDFPSINGAIIDHFIIDDYKFIVVAARSVIKFEIIGPGIVSFSVFVDNDLNVLSAAYDSSSDIIYLGEAQGTIIPLNVSAENFGEANLLDPLTLTESTDPTGVTALFIDVRPSSYYLYAATRGEQGAPATLHRIDLSGSKPVDDVNYYRFGANDFDVVNGVFDAVKGLLFLIADTSPGRIIQISLPTFTWESSLEAEFDGPNSFSFGVWYDDFLYISGTELGTFLTQLNIYSAPDSCLSNCFDHGVCAERSCTCDTFISLEGNTLEYQLPWCEERACDYNCSGNAVGCIDGNCTCFAEWTGNYCQERRCPNDCITPEFGTCNEDTFECQCEPGHSGDDCSNIIDLPCPMYLTCGECKDAVACGWCASTESCHQGNPITPFEVPSCPDWNFGDCPSGIFIAAIVLLVILGLLLLVNFLSYAYLYTSGADIINEFVKHEWYSLQRANKWWVALEQTQLMGATLFMRIGFPTILTSFLTWFSWAIFAPPTSFLWGERVPANISNFNTIEYPAALYLGYTGIEFSNLSLSVLISWLIAVGGLTILFTLILVIVTSVRGGEVGVVVTTKPVYIILRLIDMAVLPFALFGGIALTNFDEAGLGGGIGIILLVAAALYLLAVTIYFILVTVQNNKKSLFQPGSKGRCLFIYGHLKNDSFQFAFFNVLRKFLLGLFIGLFHSVSGVAQIISIIAVSIIFIVLIWVLDFHADRYQKFCETGVGICNILAFACLFGFGASLDGLMGDGTGSTIVSVLYVVFMAISIGICMTMFFFNWFQKEGAFSPKQIFGLCLCQDTSDD